MSKLFERYLAIYSVGRLEWKDVDDCPARELRICAIAMRDRHNGKLLTRAEFLAEIGVGSGKLIHLGTSSLSDVGARIHAIKVVREVSSLGLKEATDVVDAVCAGGNQSFPSVIKKTDAKAKLIAAGLKVL